MAAKIIIFLSCFCITGLRGESSFLAGEKDIFRYKVGVIDRYLVVLNGSGEQLIAELSA
ncbi:MAG: hypothetical protein ACLSFV_07670 [Bacteroides xylanisolvens]